MRKCSGCIVTRKKKGGVQVLMIRSSTTNQWTHPKGGIEGKLSSAESAVKEVYEEAGIIGAISSALGSHKGRSRGLKTSIEWFHLKSVVVLKDYPECATRDRKWFSAARAIQMTRKSLRPIVKVSVQSA